MNGHPILEDIIQKVAEKAEGILPYGMADHSDARNGLMKAITEDLLWLAENDPAAHSSEQVKRVYLSFKSVAYYRLAHIVWTKCGFRQTKAEDYKDIARFMMEGIKVETGVEIHPAAKIGKMFSIDHGTGTVIGETVEIGERCIILNGVVLGVKKISRARGKRHPTLGDNVRVGAHVGIFGPIRVGNNCEIGPYAQIFTDIPDNCSIKVVTPLQIVQSQAQKNSECPQPQQVWPASLTGEKRVVYLLIEGNNLLEAKEVLLIQRGFNPVPVDHIEKINDTKIVCTLRSQRLALGTWELHVIGTGGSGILTHGVLVK